MSLLNILPCVSRKFLNFTIVLLLQDKREKFHLQSCLKKVVCWAKLLKLSSLESFEHAFWELSASKLWKLLTNELCDILRQRALLALSFFRNTAFNWAESAFIQWSLRAFSQRDLITCFQRVLRAFKTASEILKAFR